ncbi:MAG: radical SAM family heme chaperone HemW [Flavobacteriales bacterium]
MAGLYIHIPFCRHACAYCNFHFSTNLSQTKPLTEALVKELRARKDELQTPLKSVYLGGGTPSVLSSEELQLIFNQVFDDFEFDQNCEITIEVNPEDLTASKLEFWSTLGINRLSMGIQSFFSSDLDYMGRKHSPNQALEALKLIQQSDFENYSVDLIYGSPTSSDAQWKANLEQLEAFDVPHLSCYALTVEPETKLEYRIKRKKAVANKADDAVRQFEILQDWASTQGFEHYELSNLAKPNRRAVHNSNYWSGKPYLGIGPGAHSFDGKHRRWNIENNGLYIKGISEHTNYFETETLSQKDVFNEQLMLGLRTQKGLNINDLKSTCPQSIFESFLQNIKQKMDSGFVLDEQNLKIHPKFWMRSDGLISDLFWV